MARAVGQIDLAKTEAILDAAVAVLSEGGVSAPMDEIARRAGVSKQTIYNHYGSKADLVRALATRRVSEIAGGLDTPEALEDPASALAGYARALLSALLSSNSVAFLRMAMAGGSPASDISQAMYDAGPRATRLKLADFLARETEAGRLACPDPLEAAEFFGGMVIGSRQTAALLGVPRAIDGAGVERLATEAAARFMRAYAP